MDTKETYIKSLAYRSKTDRHELIQECLDFYGLFGTKELNVEQLKKFCEMKGL